MIIIAVVDRNGVIGHRVDLRYTRNTILGFMSNWFEFISKSTEPTEQRPNVAVVAGRKSADLIGLLGGAMFVNRYNIVLSNTLAKADVQINGVTIICGLPQLRITCSILDVVFVIGGAHTFATLIKDASELWLCQVNAELSGTLRFPDWDPNKYELLSRESMPPSVGLGHDCSFAKYRLHNLSSSLQGSLF